MVFRVGVYGFRNTKEELNESINQSIMYVATIDSLLIGTIDRDQLQLQRTQFLRTIQIPMLRFFPVNHLPDVLHVGGFVVQVLYHHHHH